MKKVLGTILVAATLVAVFPASANAAKGVSGCSGSLMAPCRNIGGTLPPVSSGGGSTGVGTSTGGGRRPLPPGGRR